MELEKVLHMTGGNGDTSYAQNAYIAKTALEMTKSIKERAIAELFRNQNNQELPVSTTVCMADLGCASGPNTFAVVSELVIAAEKIRRKVERPELEYQVLLNDLPGNDFNMVFKLLPKFHQELKEQVGLKSDQCFVTAVPGSFYGRLFPRQSLHFAHSSYSLYWLSKLPEGLEGNKRNIYLSSSSPSDVVKAYKDQFQRDSALFLRSRSQELVKGGQMVLTYWGRSSEVPTDPDRGLPWSVLSLALNELVSEGVIEEEKVEAFNIPVYHASSTDIIEEVKKEGSFSINATDVSQVNLNPQENEGKMKTEETPENSKGSAPTKLVRSVVESVLTSHFGGAVIDQIFLQFRKLIEAEVEKQSIFLTNVTISVTKN